MSKALICVVTGASRGVGRGVALALGAAGGVVYVTGRSVNEGDSPLPGTVGQTAADVTAAGGTGIAVACDHGDDARVAALFERVRREHGRLDILVNSAIAIPDQLTEVGPFWKKSLAMTSLLDVGLRSSYVACHYAADLLIAARGLVINISSAGSRCYMHGPAYGAGKAGADKMTFDMAYDFKPEGVSVVALWPGLVKTERSERVCAAEPDKYGDSFDTAETPQFIGCVVLALHGDADCLSKRSGGVFYTSELASQYGVQDVDGAQPPSPRAYFGAPPEFSPVVVE